MKLIVCRIGRPLKLIKLSDNDGVSDHSCCKVTIPEPFPIIREGGRGGFIIFGCYRSGVP